MKNFTIILFLGFLGGLFGSYLFLNYFTENYLANIFQPSLLVQSLIPPISNSSPWEKTITDSFSGTVAVQTFLDNKIVRQGTGIVLSSDGIVATVATIPSDERTIPVPCLTILLSKKVCTATVPEKESVIVFSQGLLFETGETKDCTKREG